MSNIWRNHHTQLDYPNKKNSQPTRRPAITHIETAAVLKPQFYQSSYLAATVINPTPKGTFKSAGMALWAAEFDWLPVTACKGKEDVLGT